MGLVWMGSEEFSQFFFFWGGGLFFFVFLFSFSSLFSYSLRGLVGCASRFFLSAKTSLFQLIHKFTIFMRSLSSTALGELNRVS